MRRIRAHFLVRTGLIALRTPGRVGQRMAAALTPAGHEALGVPDLAAAWYSRLCTDGASRWGEPPGRTDRG